MTRPRPRPRRRLRRSRRQRAIFGVCGGLASLLNVDPALVRVAFVLLGFFSGGLGILLYLGLALAIPTDETERGSAGLGTVGRAILAGIVFWGVWLLVLMFGAPLGLGFLLALLAASGTFFWNRISSVTRGSAMSGVEPDEWLASSGASGWERIASHRKDFDRTARELAPLFSPEPLENPAIFEIHRAYLHEPVEVRHAFLIEHERYRERFLRWQERVRAHTAEVRKLALADEWSDAPDHLFQESWELARELESIRAYLDELNQKAAEAAGSLDRAIQVVADAQTTLGGVLPRMENVAADSRLAALRPKVDRARSLLDQARQAIVKGDEKPLTAIRLADEALAIANEVRDRIDKSQTLPDLVARRLREAEDACRNVEAEIAVARDDIRAAAEEYAPSCWLDIRGAGVSAERSLARAKSLCRSLRDRHDAIDDDPTELDKATRQLDEVDELIGRAADLTQGITSHLRRLETAAQNARSLLRAAEVEIDRAFTQVDRTNPHFAGKSRELLQRASDLTRQARDELTKEKPDWLAVVEWAERATRLAGAAQRDAVGVSDDEGLFDAVETARERARSARDHAWAAYWSIGRDRQATMRRTIDGIERAYRQAVMLHSAARAEVDPARRVARGRRAIVAFDQVETAATRARDTMENDIVERGSSAPAKPMATERTAESPIWTTVWGTTELADDQAEMAADE